MSSTARPEKVAQLVMSATDKQKHTQHEQVHDFGELHNFIEGQVSDTELDFTWHYLDPQLRRRLVLTCSRHAVSLAISHLEISRFSVEAHELYKEPHSELMGAFVLNASGMFSPETTHEHYIQAGMQNPDVLYQRYDALRRRTTEQMSTLSESELRGFDATIRELRGGAPAA